MKALSNRLKAPLPRLLLLLLAAAAPHGPHMVALTEQPGSALAQQAALLAAADLRAARHAHETPVLLVGSAVLGHGPPALFVQVQSASLCGSAGCATSVFVPQGHGWRKVLDSVSGPIGVASTRHHGMHDLIVGVQDRWVWTGHTYEDTMPVPSPNLAPNLAPNPAPNPAPHPGTTANQGAPPP